MSLFEILSVTATFLAVIVAILALKHKKIKDLPNKGKNIFGIIVRFDFHSPLRLTVKNLFTPNKQKKKYITAIKDSLESEEFQFIKTKGNAILFLGDNPKSLFSGFKKAKDKINKTLGDKNGFHFKAVAHFGTYYYKLNFVSNQKIALNNKDFLYQMDKEGELGSITVSQILYEEYSGDFESEEIKLIKKNCPTFGNNTNIYFYEVSFPSQEKTNLSYYLRTVVNIIKLITKGGN